MRNKGFTLIELTIAIGILAVVFSMIFTTYITVQKLWRGGFTQIAFQSRGRIVLGGISRNIRSSVGSTILANGDRIRFVVDPNKTPETSTDDITSEYYLSGTDIMYDPDISVSGDQVSLLRNAYRESTIPIFQISGDLIVVTFRLFSSDSIYGAYWATMSTSITMRNV